MRQSKHMSSEGLSGELHAFLNPLAPLRDTLGMTFDEVKIQIERNITYGIQKLAPVVSFLPSLSWVSRVARSVWSLSNDLDASQMKAAAKMRA